MSSLSIVQIAMKRFERAWAPQTFRSSTTYLFLGHGRRAWNAKEKFRCSPIILDQFNEQDTIIFLDFDRFEEPDIVENVGNNWSKYVNKYSVDYIIDTITHLPIKERFFIHYWNSIKHALKMMENTLDGIIVIVYLLKIEKD